MDTRIFLEGNRNKRSVNTSNGLKIDVLGGKKLLPSTEFDADISEFEQYKQERSASTKFRLTFQVNPLCTNILHNKISEIVKEEGSDNVKFLNYGICDQNNIGKKRASWYSSNTMTYKSTSGGNTSLSGQEAKHPTNAIRDTYPTNSGYVYHCGSDILNNHLLRSNTFKVVCTSNGDEWFNTIADMMRDSMGNDVVETITFPTSANIPNNSKKVKLHLYEYDDILSYKDCLKERLRSAYNGWVGFNNTSKIKTYENFNTKNDTLNVEKPIMYMNGGDFIDMYPSRDLYSFIPKYNKFRHRLEKNWNYCLTYPSSSTTRGFDDIINRGVGSLKTIFFSEKTRADNGTEQIVLFSIAKHGLKVGDCVNVYNKNNKVIDSAKVTNIADEFTFTIFKQATEISSKWVLAEYIYNNIGNASSEYNNWYTDGRSFYDEDGNKFYIVGEWVNVDKDAQDISYKKVSNNIECEYYIRIFSRIPNFKYAEEPTHTENDIYKDDAKTLKKYQNIDFDFTSEVSKLAFARNVYGDEIGQIVYTDDIDLANLRDNLGRPLTQIYLTIVKNNKGYKQWYGFGNNVNWSVNEIKDDSVEFSHCFGKVSCGLDTSSDAMADVTINNIHSISNANMPYGYDVSYINDLRPNISSPNGDSTYEIDDNEVYFDTDTNFYGDLVCHDMYQSREDVIQPILHRFNTAQRESAKSSSAEYFKAFNYDEITNDDYDRNDKYLVASYSSNQIMNDRCNNLNEGYYYKPHYEIKVRTEGELRSVMPDFLPIRSMVSVSSETRFNVSVYPYLSVGDKCMLFDKKTKKLYHCTVTSSDASNLKTFTCMVTNEDGTMADDLANITQGTSDEDRLRYKLFKIDNLDIPTYARPMTDGTCRMIWRDIFNNGSGNFVEDNEYVFTNGAFYINMGINLFVRRQDPDGIYGLYSNDDIIGEALDYDSEDTYYTEENITC